MQLSGDAGALADARVERRLERVLHLPHAGPTPPPAMPRPVQRKRRETHSALDQGGVIRI